MKYWAYGKLGLKPWELYGMDLAILGEMILACNRAEEEYLDRMYQLTSWQTALLMNSTGNYKKQIKPADIYTPLADAKEKEKSKEYNPEERKRLQEELLNSFKHSNIIIQ